MSSIFQFGALGGCLGWYRWAYDRFGTDPFDPRRLTPGTVSDVHERGELDPNLAHSLDLLVAAGLFERTSQDQYRVLCTPDESVEQWQEKVAPRLSALHRRIQETPADEGGGFADDTDALTRADETFFSVRVTSQSDVESVTAALSEMYDSDAYDGIVLRSSGENAATAQRVADILENGAATNAIRSSEHTDRFEKLTTDLVGEHKDALEFRLYLREVS